MTKVAGGYAQRMLWFLVPAIWIFLLVFWGGFWRADQRLGTAPSPERWPEVAAVIPARDEAATIAEVVADHKATDYPGPFRVLVVDDSSQDGTGDLALAAGAEVVTAPPLEPGWSGKLWALNAGLAKIGAPKWVLLTDADILHAPGTLRALVSKGEADGLAMVSLMARLDTRGFWGRLLIPAFVFFFQKLYPFPWVNRPGHWYAAAAGGCVLIRREALEGIGGIAAIRGALIDDCTLAAKVKHGPPARPIWLGLAQNEVVSLRDNRALASIWEMVARTAFTQLHHSWLLLVCTIAGMSTVYLAPVGLSVIGSAVGAWEAATAGALAWGAMILAYAPTLRLYGLPAWHGAALPVAAAFYSAMTVSSALRQARGQGGRWKGRIYD